MRYHVKKEFLFENNHRISPYIELSMPFGNYTIEINISTCNNNMHIFISKRIKVFKSELSYAIMKENAIHQTNQIEGIVYYFSHI